MGNSTIAVVAAVVLGALASKALADDIHVPGDFRRLQDALDAATPGDRVFVDRGIHRGPIEVTTPGIEIVGSPKARIVGRKAGRNHRSLFVRSDGVALRGLTFVRGGLRADAHRLTVDGCTFRRYPDADVGRAVIDVSGFGAVITGNEVVSDCRGPMAIEVVGDRARVTGNRVAGRLTDFAVRVVGVEVVVEGNDVTAPLALRGILVAGDGAIVRENRLEAADLSVFGDGNTVVGNLVSDADIGQASVTVEGDGNLLALNDVVGGLDTGFLVRGDDNLLEENSVTGNGSMVDGLPWGHGFVARGSGNVLVGDTADGCVGEAFRVVGNGEVGLVMDPFSGAWSWQPIALGAGNEITGCVGTGAGTCGLGNWTVDTSVTGSTFTGNGVDVVSGVDFDLFAGNTWDTGGPDYMGSGNGAETSDTFSLFSNFGGD